MPQDESDRTSFSITKKAERIRTFKLLTSKLQPPGLSSAVLPRQILLEKLESSLHCRLILICAPAGYGKSTLLAQLHDALYGGMLTPHSPQGGESITRPLPHVAWLNIDSADSDPVRFTNHFLKALGLWRDQDPTARPSWLEVGVRLGLDSGITAEAMRIAVRGAVEELTRDTYLFIDDLHIANSPLIEQILSDLLEAHLPRLHLVVATRQRPAWPLARLRSKNAILELGIESLSYTRRELSAVMSVGTRSTLTDSDLARIHEKTEGWPAGVQFAAVALSAESDAAEFIQRFSGADIAISEFLFEQVLHQQSEEIRNFLLGTSLLRYFSAGMVNEVLGISNGRELLDHVTQLNLFLISMDRERQWYRYHALFGDLLRRHMEESHADQARVVHQNAGAWLVARGMNLEAIEHALAIDAPSLAGAWLDAVSPTLFANGQTATLQHYAGRISPDVVATLPILQLELVWEDIINWRFDKARASLRQLSIAQGPVPSAAERFTRSPVDPSALQARMSHRVLMMEVFTDHLAEFLDQATLWNEQFKGMDPFMDASVDTATLLAQRERFQYGLIQGKHNILRRQFVDAGAIYGTVFLDSVVGSILFDSGELPLATEVTSKALETALRIQGAVGPLSSMAASQLAAMRYEQGDIDGANALLSESLAFDGEFGLVDGLIARVVIQARIERHRSGVAAAHRVLDMGELLAEHHALHRLKAHVMAERAMLWAESGQTSEQRKLLNTITLDRQTFDGTQERLANAYIRLQIELGHTSDALPLIRQWLSWLAPRGAIRALIQMHLLAARAHLHMGDRQAAQRALLEALKRAAPGRYIQTLKDEGPAILNLLNEFAPLIEPSSVVDGQYLTSLVRTDEQRTEARPTDSVLRPVGTDAPFNERELDILRLTALNLRTEEIAKALGVTASTVKWYWQRIFEKTSVRRRVLAVRLARESGLLE